MAERLLSPSADCYLAFAHELREKCHKLEHIKGAAKLERKILAEIKFLKNLLRRSTKVQESHLKSSNLSHFAAIVHASENLPGAVDILQAFSCPGKNESLIVDVVAGQGHIWVKVIARKAQALHLVWAGQGQFGERDLLRQADDYLRSAQEHPHIYTTPKIYFLFYNNVTFSMAKALHQRGVHVLGHQVPVDADVEHKLNDLHLEVSDDDDDDDDDDDNDDDGDGDDEDGGGGEGDDGYDDDGKIMGSSDYQFDASAWNKVASNEENNQTQTSKNTETATSNNFCPSRHSLSSQSKASVDEEFCRKAETFGKVGKAVTDSFFVDQRGIEAGAPEPEGDSDSKHSTNSSDLKGGKHSEPGHIFEPCLSEQKGSDGSELKPISSSDSKQSSPIDARDFKESVSEPCGQSYSEPSQSASKLSSQLDRKAFDLDSSSDSNPSAQLESKESGSADYKPEANHSCSANYNLLMGELLGVLPDIRNSVVDTNEDIVNSVSKLNLDITTLITLVSAVTHGHSNFMFTEKILTMQAEEERTTPVLPGLVKFMKGKELFACRSAVEDFRTILATLGGEGEKQRATELMSRVKIIEDNPSQKALQLKNLGKIKDRSKTIFGTGDSLEAITMTANSGFLRACKGQGVSFAVFVHAARALTEDKEKTATPL